MNLISVKTAAIAVTCFALFAACSNERKLREDAFTVETGRESKSAVDDGSSLFDIFRDGGTKVKVNRFLWTASLQVLDFLPVENADPFTGVISTGFGRPPGGGQVYRATILISDPALDARSLNVALQTRGGAAVSTATQRAVEDAILTRARQLRVQAKGF
ncbi:MAG: DUF3576 domain-containing protein [Pseudomonadota bacterium]